jgi:hypothetical protein
MFLIRRWFREMGTIAVLTWLWAHRGTVTRTVDLAARAPSELSQGRWADLGTEARAIKALDRDLAAARDVRITQVADGTICFRAGAAPRALDLARTAVLPIPTVLDVRTDGSRQPTLDDELASLAAYS